MPVHGRRTGGNRDGASHVCRRGSPVPSVAAVPAGVRVEGVAGCGVRETRVGRTYHCEALPAVAERILV